MNLVVHRESSRRWTVYLTWRNGSDAMVSTSPYTTRSGAVKAAERIADQFNGPGQVKVEVHE